MKIIVCGAGVVGTGIARQLASEDIDVTVVDHSPELIRKMNDTSDVSAFQGVPSHPTVLEAVGASDAKMIIAVTQSDEMNMVICQVAHSLFNVPTKIARIRNQNYLQPIWKDLYRQDHLPIDYIISPEMEVANAVLNRLHVPGAMNMIPFASEKLRVIEVRVNESCPVLNMPLSTITSNSPDFKMAVIAMVRDDELILPGKSDKLMEGDELFFVADTRHVPQAMSLFGHEEQEARRVVIVGGGNIGFFLAQALEKEDHAINAKLIELNRERAEYIAGKLSDVTVIHGNSLDREILEEVNISSTETIITVTNDDEVNILAALLAKRSGCKTAISLINKGASYSPLIASLGIDVTVNPREITVSNILQHIRRGKVSAAHSIFGGKGEIIEVEVVPHSEVIGRTIHDLELPEGILIGAILRGGEETIIPDGHTILEEKDRVVILSHINQIKKVDSIFSARLDYF